MELFARNYWWTSDFVNKIGFLFVSTLFNHHPTVMAILRYSHGFCTSKNLQQLPCLEDPSHIFRLTILKFQLIFKKVWQSSFGFTTILPPKVIALFYYLQEASGKLDVPPPAFLTYLCPGRPCFSSSDVFSFCCSAFLSISLLVSVFPVSLPLPPPLLDSCGNAWLG